MSHWGELRAWLASATLDGTRLHHIFDTWQQPELLHTQAIPYCLEHMRRHDLRVRTPAPYSAWFDALLTRAFQADAQLDVALATQRYDDCLRVKPDAAPAHQNLYRLAHHDRPFEALLDAFPWQAYGPYDTSWANVCTQLCLLKPGISTQTVQGILAALDADVEHQSTLYPTTLITAFALVHYLGQPWCAAGVQDCMQWLTSALIHSAVTPGKPRAWSFADLRVERAVVIPKDAQDIVAKRYALQREHVIWPYAYDAEEWGRCELPFCTHASYFDEEKSLTAYALYDLISATIEAGLPVYRRHIARHARPDLYSDALLWHLGHLARQERQEVESRHGLSECVNMTHMFKELAFSRRF